MKRSKIIKRGILGFIIFCVIGCAGRSKKEENSLVAETYSISLERFDRDLPPFVSGTINDSLRFIKEYYDFLPIYCYGILDLPQNGPKDSIYNQTGLNEFLSHPAIKKLYEDTETAFQKTDDIEMSLSDAFSRYTQLFPGSYIPRVLTHVSGLNQSIITSDSLISISLDHYLGASYPGYQNVYYPYQLPAKERKRIAIDAIQVWLYTQFSQNDTDKTLLDKMVYEGSILYALQQIFPQKELKEILGYSDNDIAWCQKNEKAIWDRIIRQRHLFATDLLLKNKYLEPAPFTSPISSESPGRFGRWIGWRIISEYMKKEDCSLSQLLEQIDNGEQILKTSRYKGS